MPTAAAHGDFADVFRPSAPPFVSPVRENVNVIGAIVSREDSKARIKAARYTTTKTTKLYNRIINYCLLEKAQLIFLVSKLHHLNNNRINYNYRII